MQRLGQSEAARQAARFAMVGALATAAHYAVLIVLVEAVRMAPVAATTIGFCVGVGVSYPLNRRFTFTSHAPLAPSFAKYAALYGVGLLLNGGIFAGLTELGAPYLAAQIGATAIVMLWNFLGARFVAFR